MQVGRLAVDRNDALFNHLDRDKDGTVTKDELGAAVPSLHRFDLDGDELIDTTELEPFSNPMAALDQEQTRRGKYATVPPVIELSSDDPSFRRSGWYSKNTTREQAPVRRPATIG